MWSPGLTWAAPAALRPAWRGGSGRQWGTNLLLWLAPAGTAGSRSPLPRPRGVSDAGGTCVCMCPSGCRDRGSSLDHGPGHQIPQLRGGGGASSLERPTAYGFLPALPVGGGLCGQGASGWGGCRVVTGPRGSSSQPGSPAWAGRLWGAGAAGLVLRPAQLCGPGQGLAPGARTLLSVQWGRGVGVRVNLGRARPSVLAWEQGGLAAGGPSEPRGPHLPGGERSFLLWCWDMARIARQRPATPGRWGALGVGLGSVGRM